MKFLGQTFGYPAVAVGFMSLKSKLIYKKCLSCCGFRLETFRTGTLCDPESLKGGGGLQHLKYVFIQKGYSKSDKRRALHPKQKSQLDRGKPQCYIHDVVSNGNRRITEKFNTSTIRRRNWKTHAEAYKDCLKIWSPRRIWGSSLLVRWSMRGAVWMTVEGEV
jgi:hypothetical protein